jgi:hypothetical protein
MPLHELETLYLNHRTDPVFWASIWFVLVLVFLLCVLIEALAWRRDRQAQADLLASVKPNSNDALIYELMKGTRPPESFPGDPRRI